MVPFDVVKLLFEIVTPLSKRMEGGVTVSNEFNKRQIASSLFLFLAHQKLLPSFPSPLEVTGASPFPPLSFLCLVCITYFEFLTQRISGTKSDYSQSTKRRHNGFENGTRDKFATHLRKKFSHTIVYIHKLQHTPRILSLVNLSKELVPRIQNGGLTTA